MKILVTGAAGFIGFHLSKQLLSENHEVVGVDNLNDYYDVHLKIARLQELGIQVNKNTAYGESLTSNNYKFKFLKLSIEDRTLLPELFKKESFDVVCNLAAQAGVRYSIENPNTYIDTNVVGFLNVLESCRHHNVKKLVYASSSSVYGMSDNIPFSTEERVDHPISLYAASKKSNELMAHTYSHLYGIKTVGLRFFTVYGPWGRPDMALFLFTEAIYNQQPIKIFNEGKMSRDFTFVTDIVDGVDRVINTFDKVDFPENAPFKIYNIGNGQPEKLLDFVEEIENCIGIKAKREYLPMQAGDVEKTWADVSAIKNELGYQSKVNVKEGIQKFISWYNQYYKK
ncbi:NAD-dependent epimerase [Zhouia sp. PK063]|uniref:NAD-dependent epimerase n=1 Tax=Zhouia sp. PK063 TaxID=3373602 RepID=UPI0037A35AE9